jgi:hypothetical protein
MIIMLLIFLNMQVAFFIFGYLTQDDGSSLRNKLKDEFDQKLISVIESLDLNLKEMRQIYDKQSNYSYNLNLEIAQATKNIKYIYNLLLLKENEDYENQNVADLEFDKALREKDEEKIGKIYKMMIARWEMRMRQIEK